MGSARFAILAELDGHLLPYNIKKCTMCCRPRYLAADMQLHVAGVLALLVAARWRRLAAPLLAGPVLGAALAAALLTYFYNLTPIITAQPPEYTTLMLFTYLNCELN